MSKRYAIRRSDGGVSVMQCVGDATPESCIEKWLPEHRESVVSITEIDTANIPTDRTFRDAWKVNGAGIDHDMPKARTIQLSLLRLERNKRLDALDKDWIAATGRGMVSEAASIEANKQVLRDLPTTVQSDFDGATTPEELIAAWPIELG